LIGAVDRRLRRACAPKRNTRQARRQAHYEDTKITKAHEEN